MPGPTPKPAALRQRRNRATSTANLPAERAPRERDRKPYLPRCPDADDLKATWHPMARRWWNDVWASPMHHQFLRGDEPALLRLMVLVDRFWKTQALDVAREIRMLEREFGLTPLSRRRLEWNVVQAEEAKDKFEQRRVKRATVIDGDPRSILDTP